MTHPHLPRGAGRLEYPVGRVTVTRVSWGGSPECGKERPALIIGASGDRLWIRPIYTNDYKAGLWRSVVIDDWKRAGLKRQCYVSVDVLEVRRHQCGPVGNKLSVHDWNRVCRGEVHD
jgi:hypothetical protein